MKGPFIVIFKDYFDITHTWIVMAQTAEEAIEKVEIQYGYPIKEIVDSYTTLNLLRQDWRLLAMGEIEWVI